MSDADAKVTHGERNGHPTEPISRSSSSPTLGLDVTVQLEQVGGNRSDWIEGAVSSITQQTLQLAVPLPTPLDRAARLRLRIAQLRLDLTIASESCWSRAGDGLQWRLGCTFVPPLPDDALKRLTAEDPPQASTSAADRCLLRGTAAVASDNSRFAVRVEQFGQEGFVAVSSHPAKVGEVTRFHFESVEGVVSIDARTSWQLKTAEHYLIAGAWTAGEDYRRLQRVVRSERTAAGEQRGAAASRKGEFRAVRWLSRLAGAVTVACFAVPCLLLFYSSSGDGRAESSVPTGPPAEVHARPAELDAQRNIEKLESLEAEVALRTQQAAARSQRLALSETQLAEKERQLDVQRRQTDQLRDQFRELVAERDALLVRLRSLEETVRAAESSAPPPVTARGSDKGSESLEPTAVVTAVADDETPAAAPAGGRSPSERVWTDQSGRFHITATLIGVEEGVVRLQRPDGRTATIELAKLSAADRDYVMAKQAAGVESAR
jgi:hypothetical protein